MPSPHPAPRRHKRPRFDRKESPMRQGQDDSSVSFRKVRKSYGASFTAVENLDLDIRSGEFLTLLGPSGSGKTTTLMMLAGFEMPTSGEIAVGGRSIVTIPPNRRDIGMVFQSYALFPHMTVFENIAFPLKVRGRASSEIRDRTRRILDMVGLEAISHRLPTQLSGGQQQRVAVARALVFEPRIVLMDEPLAALDKQLREHMQLEIRALHDKIGVTTVYVTHDQTEALVMSDRIAVFNGGRLQQIASPREIYERPANEFVSGFIGDNNLLRGKVIRSESGSVVVDVGAGNAITGRSEAALAAGTPVSVAIRPERIALSAGAGTHAATVEQVIYVGDRLRLALRLTGGQALVATTANAGHATALHTGKSVELELPREYCRVFVRPAEDAAVPGQ
jgi:putative spermidine/putrescine transport system ATP-binding protein